MVVQYTLTITAAPQRLSQAIPTDKTRGATQDLAIRELWVSAGTDCFIGDANVTTSVYGKKIFADTATTPAYRLGPYDCGPIKLSDIYVVGTSGTLFLLAVPY
jgi:hypothetical protein